MRDLQPHLPTVFRLARALRRRLPRSVQLDELVSDGLLGWLHADRRYQPGRSVPFDCFAQHHIIGAMLDGLRERDWATRDMRRGHQQLPAVWSLSQVAAEELADRRAASPQDVPDAREATRSLRDLERRQRVALSLYFLEGLNLKETGKILAMTEAGASLLVRRALKCLAAAPTPGASIQSRKKQPRGRRDRGVLHFSPHAANHR